MRYWIIVLLSFTWVTTEADWKLDKQSSSLSYVSIKNNDIGEVNYFKSFDAKILENGDLTMVVDLDSVDTRYKLRDERMRKLFFDAENFAKATIKGKMPVRKIATMHPGSVRRHSVQVTLDLYGRQQKIEADLRLVKNG